MLFARILRSPLPHARVRSIDTSAAEALPGVMAILHAKNTDAVWSSGDLDPLQKAFMEHDAPQCGYCTSGQLMSAKALLARNPNPTREEVQRGLTGNLCRCSNYNRIVESVLAASQKA